MSNHKRAPWIVIKNALEDKFEGWIDERKNTDPDFSDVIEFMYQQGFINGKKWLEFIDSIEYPMFWWQELRFMEPMREGYIPPKAFIGPIKRSE